MSLPGTATAKGPVRTKAVKRLPNGKRCAEGNLERSQCMVRLVLDDIAANYRHAGGGISMIRALSTTSFAVSLLQEERIDVLTYEFDLRPDGSVTIKSRSESTESPGAGP